MLNELIGFLFLLFPLNLFSMTLNPTCDLLKTPRECQCQPFRHIPINETRLRCRQLTEITSQYSWSQTSYDRLIFETSNENLTLHQFVFTDLIVRTLRFQIQNLFLQDHSIANAHIGQLSIFNSDTYGRIGFEYNCEIFSGSTITDLEFKSIDFQSLISENIFSNTKIYIFLIKSSKFYGFTNEIIEINNSSNLTTIKHDHFLEYDFFKPKNLQLNNGSEQTIIITNTTMIDIKIYTIISSINTTNLTENYFPINLNYKQLEEIELSFNKIDCLNANVFQHLEYFQGQLLLKNNQIKYLHEQTFDNLFLLKNLSLKNNFLENLTSRYFQDLKQLNQLDLSFNQIYQLDNNIFEYLQNLEILYLNFNPIKFIHPDTFSNLTKLKQIHFQGIQFIHLIDQGYFQWIWNLASLHVVHLLKTDFDLSDVAFCILSRYNQTLYHLSREYSCSCNIHYFNLNQNLTENTSIPLLKYQTNYLRLTPICNENNTDSIFEEQINENDLILHNLENTCNYKLIYLDCDAMTTTTIQSTTLIEQEIESIINSNDFPKSTTEMSIPTIPSHRMKDSATSKQPLRNMKKLFTVLGTLLAITICAIILVFFWYRFKSMLKRRKKKKSFVEHQRHFNSPAIHNHSHPITPRYASSDMSGSVHSGRLSISKSQSEALIEPSISNIYKNFETITNEPMKSLLNDKDTKAVTQC